MFDPGLEIESVLLICLDLVVFGVVRYTSLLVAAGCSSLNGGITNMTTATVIFTRPLHITSRSGWTGSSGLELSFLRFYGSDLPLFFSVYFFFSRGCPQIHEYSDVSEIDAIVAGWLEKQFPNKGPNSRRTRGGRGDSRDRSGRKRANEEGRGGGRDKGGRGGENEPEKGTRTKLLGL